MVKQHEQLDEQRPILAVECSEPDGKIVRTVSPGRLSFNRLRYLWDKLSQFDVLFNDYVAQDFKSFVSNFVMQENGQPVPTGLIWDVDDVGIFYLTDIHPMESGLAHFVFWDRRFKGREELCREMLRFLFDRYKFHRIRVEVPLYAKYTLQAVERIGFIKEGRARDAVRYKGEWFDVNFYSMLEGEL